MESLEDLVRIKNTTNNDEEIIKFIIEKPEQVINMSIYNLAQATHTSTSSIIRFCKKCNYKGFKDFKISLIQCIDKEINDINNVDVNMPFKKNDTDLVIAKKISQLSIETIKATFNLLSSSKLQTAVDQIINANSVFAVGVGDNYIRLCDFKTKLLLINFYIKMTQLEDDQIRLTNLSTKKDVAIILSYSGETKKVLECAQKFFLNRTPIIAITSNEHSHLASLADQIFLIPNKENSKVSFSNFSSHVSIEYILNTIYSCMFSRNYLANCKYTQN